MDEVQRRDARSPLPLPLAFLVCQDIYRDERSGRAILVSPTSHVPLPQFPAQVRVSVFIEFTEGRGRYEPRLSLRDEAEELVWEWALPEALEHWDPLLPHQVIFHDVLLAATKPGRFSLVFLLNDEELTRRAIWFESVEAPRHQ